MTYDIFILRTVVAWKYRECKIPYDSQSTIIVNINVGLWSIIDYWAIGQVLLVIDLLNTYWLLNYSDNPRRAYIDYCQLLKCFKHN